MTMNIVELENGDEALHYTLCGLDNILLLNGYTIKETPAGRGISIQDVKGLHEAIGLHVAKEKRILTGKEIKFLRKEMDMTQSQLARLLDCDVQTVARWEREEAENRAGINLLRTLYVEHVNKTELARDVLEKLAEMDVLEEAQMNLSLGHNNHWDLQVA